MRIQNLNYKIIIIFFLIISCKGNKDNITKSIKEKLNTNLNSIDTLKQKTAIYYYINKETKEKQKITINWNSETIFHFNLVTDTNLCKYEDTGVAKYKYKNTYSVIKHPVLKLIKFDDNKTKVNLICEYENHRDECDPIEEFEMIKY